MFQINGEWWHVYLVPPYFHHLMRTDGSLSVGTCDDYNKAIYISDELYGSFLKKVLCHEITHAAMFSYDVELSLEQEEIVADIIATYGEEIVSVANNVFQRLIGIA